MKNLHFTLGPVQSFVEQARRTRDLWAGSFLLSYLSGQAMKAVIEAGGKIVFPAVQDGSGNPTDELLKAIMGEAHQNPQIGSLPNRFKAQVPDSFQPERCKGAVLDAWREVARAVRETYLNSMINQGNGTETIWDRQVENFWDMAWVMGDSDDPEVDGAWLDQRKNWRTYTPSEEGGDHCTLMGDWQELSGFIRAKQRNEQNAFWDALRGWLGNLDLGKHERLSAIAIIKRLYPKVANEAIGWPVDDRTWPSTSYMAAIPWLEEITDIIKDDDRARQLRCFVNTYPKHVKTYVKEGSQGEYHTDLNCIDKIDKEALGAFANLDGQLYYRHALESDKERGLSDEGKRKLTGHLGSINSLVGQPPSPFYALLLMDGDHLGKLLQEPDGERVVSDALSEFTQEVDSTIRDHCGKTIYAGGDDVMALLPLTRALTAAQEIHERYRAAFKQKAAATISGAVVFAHYHLSLRSVLKEAHHQLDDVAKEQNERDSLAVSVLTGSGRTIQWVSSWQDTQNNFFVTDVLQDLSRRFGEDEQFSSKFFYNLRERLGVLVDEKTNVFEVAMDHADFWFLKAEYQRNRETENTQTAEQNVHDLLKVCRERKHGKADEQTLVPDGALLVRFLAAKGKGVER